MTDELSILAIYGLVVMATIVFQVLMSISQVGIIPLLGNRDDLPPFSGMADRCRRSLDNSVVAMALFAPAVLLLHAQSGFSPATLLAAQIFLAARVAYAAVYAVGIPWIRTLIWTVGFFATGYLYLMAL